jgi:DNA-directed RNA polymerase subunit RPC12/RpoP
MGWKMVEYECNECGVFESLEQPPVSPTLECKICGQRGAGLIVSAPSGGARVFEVQRGGIEPTPPGCISTKPKGW